MSNLSQILADSNWGQESARINQNFQNINTDLEKVKSATTKFKGYFTTEESLTDKIASPKIGDTAWVGEPYPGTVYDVQTDGQWHNTGKAPDTGSVDLQDYAKKEELTELEIRNIINIGDRVRVNLSGGYKGGELIDSEYNTGLIGVNDNTDIYINIFLQSNYDYITYFNQEKVFIDSVNQGGGAWLEKVLRKKDFPENTAYIAISSSNSNSLVYVQNIKERVDNIVDDIANTKKNTGLQFVDVTNNSNSGSNIYFDVKQIKGKVSFRLLCDDGIVGNYAVLSNGGLGIEGGAAQYKYEPNKWYTVTPANDFLAKNTFGAYILAEGALADGSAVFEFNFLYNDKNDVIIQQVEKEINGQIINVQQSTISGSNTFFDISILQENIPVSFRLLCDDGIVGNYAVPSNGGLGIEGGAAQYKYEPNKWYTVTPANDFLAKNTFGAYILAEGALGNGKATFQLDTKTKETGSTIGSDWEDLTYSSYGDSVSAINNGDFSKPYAINDNTPWGNHVANYYGMAKQYGRGIGGQKFAWGNGGGSVAFVDTLTGNYNSRNDGFNYDNYTGEIPDGTTKVRGCACSWLRIKTMYPESIKNSINLITVMYHNDADSATDDEFEFIPGKQTDPEWAADLEYYNRYGGDYNIETLRGGIASTIMKLQAWMPQAIIVLCTPISGRGDTGELNPELSDSGMEKVAENVRYMHKKMSIPLIDMYATDGINGLNRTTYIQDGIHPYLPAGKKMVARAMIGGLKTIIPNL